MWKKVFFFFLFFFSPLKQEYLLSFVRVSPFRSLIEVCKSIEKLMRNLLWEGEGEGKGLHLVRWELIERSVASGRVEIGNLRFHNKALLAKWLWQFSCESSSLWDRTIGSKFGPHSFEWLLHVVKGTYQNVWKDIPKDLPSFSHLVRCVVWEGKDTYFCEG